MSELKVASLFELEKVLQGQSNKLFYSKSEADKVIADLEELHKKEVEQLLMEIVELKDKLRHYPIMVTLLESDKKEISELKAQKAQAEDDCAYWKTKAQIERHRKFKWCHDEAKICQLRLERYEQYVTKYKDCNDPSIQRWRFLKDHYEKWYNRWWKIAEKLKPNSTATKENSDG